ncbi:MAG: serine--tRNA ligase, partial [Oscillospiraceae bacterium]
MLDLKFVRENPEIVKKNIENKFQSFKLPLVDEVIALDAENRRSQSEANELRNGRNKISKEIGNLMANGKKEEAEELKIQVSKNAERLAALEALENELGEKIKKIMMILPNIIDETVPIGRDDSENVEVERFGDPFVPDFPIPYHTEIMERFKGIDLDAARRVAGNGFYYLMGDIARL